MRAHGYLAFAVGICLTACACLFAMHTQDRQIAGRFGHDADKVVRDTEARLKTYFDTLLAIRGMFAVHGNVSRADFHRYVAELHLAERYPGFQAIQWAVRVPEAELARHVAAVRADTGIVPGGYPGYRIHPTITRAEHFPVTYNEPMAGNENAFGLDLAALPAHLRALELGRDTGELVATERITLVQDASGQPGFIARLPVYRENMPLATVEERRAALVGFVAIVFRVTDLMREVIDPPMLRHLQVVIHDTGYGHEGTAPEPALGGLMFDSAGKLGGAREARATVPGLQSKAVLNVGQRRWLVQVAGYDGVRYGRDHQTIWLIAACGFLISTLIGALLVTLQRRREQKAQVEQAHRELSDVLDRLRQAQDTLVTSEKMASLGALVAGIAHELNTPIGNSLLTATTLAERVADVQRQLDGPGLRRSALEAHLGDAQAACGIIAGALGKAADLITSFKQVAVDQASDQRRRFGLAGVVRDTVATFAAQLRRAGCDVRIDVPDSLDCDSYPGSVSQVLSNLINNALLHAFDGRPHGTVTIAARALQDGMAELRFTDDGVGMSGRTLHQIYDPFFTTKMGQGGSGLGMNIVYNIVTGVLKGSIRVESTPGSGTTVVIMLPRTVPHAVAA